MIAWPGCHKIAGFMLLVVGVGLGRAAEPAAALAAPPAGPAAPLRLPMNLSPAQQQDLLRMAEGVRGATFQTPPVFAMIAATNLMQVATNGMTAAELAREKATGQRLVRLAAWLGVLPEDLDMEQVERRLLEGEVAGCFNTKDKHIYVNRDAFDKNSAPLETHLTLVHELVHALDDQRWDLEALAEGSADRTLARECLVEGSATFAMVQALPALIAPHQPRLSLGLNALFASAPFQAYLSRQLSMGALAPYAEDATNGVPEAVMKETVLPYVYGFQLSRFLRARWGVDGQDYAFQHPPDTSTQALHPDRYWPWRAWPWLVTVPTNQLPMGADWTCRAADAWGEGRIGVAFDVMLDAGRGAAVAQGWAGDRLALYANPAGERVFLWATRWDSDWAARRFARAYRTALVKRFHPAFTEAARGLDWQVAPHGRAGRIQRVGRQVLILETDTPARRRHFDALAAAVRVTPPPQAQPRAAQNRWWWQYNPLLGYQREADVRVWRALLGLYRQDRCETGVGHAVLGGWLYDRRRSAHFADDSLLAGFALRRVADERRDLYRLRLLPLGLAVNVGHMAWPREPKGYLEHGSIGWGTLYSWHDARTGAGKARLLPFGWLAGWDWEKRDGRIQRRQFDLLPFGLLLKVRQDAQGTTARVLGLPVYRQSRPAP